MNHPEIDQKRLTLLHELENKLGYCFQNISLLSTALTHKSYVNENAPLALEDNERLEFLGDAVLNLCVSDLVFRKYKTHAEGQLTRLRAALVNEKNLARVACELNIGESLLLGRGEELAGSREKKTFLADALEAVIAAMYLDSDFSRTREVLEGMMNPILEDADLLGLSFDYKTALQELCQKQYKTIPVYALRNSTGPEHRKMFTVEITILGRYQGSGSGTSKKEAEQQAARQAWETLKTIKEEPT
jgi:ribonuclease III